MKKEKEDWNYFNHGVETKLVNNRERIQRIGKDLEFRRAQPPKLTNFLKNNPK
jgi:hypothetical protein